MRASSQNLIFMPPYSGKEELIFNLLKLYIQIHREFQVYVDILNNSKFQMAIELHGVK